MSFLGRVDRGPVSLRCPVATSTAFLFLSISMVPSCIQHMHMTTQAPRLAIAFLCPTYLFFYSRCVYIYDRSFLKFFQILHRNVIEQMYITTFTSPLCSVRVFFFSVLFLVSMLSFFFPMCVPFRNIPCKMFNRKLFFFGS